MTAIEVRGHSRLASWGWGILLAISALLVLNGVTLFFVSASPSTFEQDTGVPMGEVRQSYPTLVDQIVGEGQNIAILLTGIGLTNLMVAWEGFCRRTRWAWNTLWVLVATLAAVGLKVILLGGRVDIGGLYLAFAVVTLAGQLLARRELSSRDKGGMKVVRVENDAVWQQIRILFLASALLFLANVYLGFDNALTSGAIPRWQTLVHLHAGTLGWVTLSAFGLMIWFFSGRREVSEANVRGVRVFSSAAIAVFAGYVLSFGLAFGLGRPWFYLLPIFGTTASLLIWSAAVLALLGLRRQRPVTTAHILITAGLLVASLGSTVGVLLGLEYLVGFFIPGTDRIGAHAAVMEAYVLLFAAAIVEGFLGKNRAARWTWAGLALTLVWSLAAIWLLLGLLFGSPLGFLFVPFLLLGLVIFLARTGWRALRINPLGRGPERWFLFGTLWVTLWLLFFIYIGATYAENLAAIPEWVAVVFQHGSFVGTMTNLLLGVYSFRSRNAAHILPRGETAAMWLINLGLPAFFALELAAGSRLGAIVMGAGVLLGVAIMIVRLLLSDLRWAYDLLYRERAPWEMDGPRPELVEMVEQGQLQPCRAIDLGCGTGDNVIFLAQHGFDAVGVDLSPRAIAQAREKARAAGVAPAFVVGDVTDLQGVEGSFDLVLDYGCLGCVVGTPAREQYAQTLLRLTRPGAQYILLNFAAPSEKRFNLVPNVLHPGEVDHLFGNEFEVQAYDGAHGKGPFGMTVEMRRMRRIWASSP